MPKCPACEREITLLKDYSKSTTVFDLKLTKEGEVKFSGFETTPRTHEDEYKCPECGTTLFQDMIRAEEFLKKGGD